MKVKITEGYVKQYWNENTQQFEAQEFIAQNSDWEDHDGNFCNVPDTDPYFPFLMKQPEEMKNES